MNNDRIPCVAFFCACLNNQKKTPRCVVSNETFGISWFKKVDQPSGRLMVFDFQRRSFFGGKLPQLVDFAEKSIVMLRPEGQMYTGFDFKTKAAFRIFVVDDVVKIYDFQTNKSYAFSVKY